MGSGQNIAQATIGAGGGLAGLVAGGKVGAAIGTAILPGVGTFAGGLIGSTIGAIAGGNIADTLTGVNSDTRRRSTIAILDKKRDKTLFSGALDQFDGTLKTLENDTAPTLMEFKKSGGRTAIANTPFMLPKGGINWNAVLNVAFIVWDVIDIIAMFKTAGASKIITDGIKLPVKKKIRKELGQNFIRDIFLPRTATRALSRELTQAAVEKQAQKTIRNNLSKDLIRQRIISNKATSETSKMTKFFRDVDDQIFLNNLPGMSRVGKIRRQGANELLMTRIDNLLDSIRGKGIKTTPLRTPTSRKTIRKKLNTNVIDDQVIINNQIREGEAKFQEVGEAITKQRLAELLGLSKKTLEPNFGRGIQGNVLDVPNTSGPLGGLSGIVGKQDGGEVSAGEPVVIGEIEPELFIPGQDGVIVPGSGRQKVLVINNGGTIQKVPVSMGSGESSTPTRMTTDIYSNLAKYAQFTSLLTV